MKSLVIYIIAVAAILLMNIGFSAGTIVDFPGPDGSANVTTGEANLLSFMTFYPLGEGYELRNYVYPYYEYTFEGDVIHFGAECDEQSVYEAENLDVDVEIDCPCAGGRCKEYAQLYFVTGSGVTYNELTNRYEAHYSGDFTTPDVNEMQGNCILGVRMTDPSNTVGFDDLSDPIYENVNDLLINPNIDFNVNYGLDFVVTYNEWNKNIHYPVSVTLNTNDDREGQGIIGNLSMRATNLVGIHYPEDIILPSDIRWKRTQEEWNYLDIDENQFVLLQEDMETDGGAGYSEQLYFELWFAADHYDTQYEGATLYFLLEIF
ncbi:hypothetical protein JW968_03300 [Candidatus Woesearchaeota archaeon]|nr:hypothetical protein [Candidatus Woesearchaeota archaeon]